MPNRLADSTSPYLLQHKDNPVDWWPWGEAAFAEARRRDVPVLLSVGYAACHWCHVMAHESFEDPDTAAAMNAGFVCVKVDREERPDVDAVYMEATQGMTGHGGWPMTCFLTPAGAPFYCGTYFPRDQFGRLLDAVGTAWRDRRDELLTAGRQVVEAMSAPRRVGTARPLDGAVLTAATGRLGDDYDWDHGGFGDAPKFPPSMVLEFLLRHRARTGSVDALRLVEHTCDQMARGGMYDQLAGGFARYAVDAGWVVPHFEKMLYDNALLLRVYLHLWRETGAPLPRRIAVETADFLLRDLRTAEGGFASALDADTAGVEGLTYVWTPAQLAEVLGAEDGAWAAGLLSVTGAGTFEHGSSTLQLRSDPEPSEQDRWRSVRTRLAAARAGRPQPGRDDKVVAAWNGLAIAALAEAGALLAEPSYLDAAVAAATLLLDVHLVDGRLRRTSRDGRVGANAGVLEDYADVAEGLLALHQATGAARWLAAAGDLLDVVLARFGDGDGGFFDTADDAETLVRRPWDVTDGPAPCGPAAAAGALLSYAALTGRTGARAAAEAALAALAPVAERYPRAAGWACATAEAALTGPLQVAIALPGPDAAAELTRVARLGTSPGLVVVAGAPDTPGVPLLADRPLTGGAPTAYVCRGFVCDLPRTDPAAVAAAVRVTA
ncbi:MAG TPA: thioredoxin domain-containing protein [Mycobacteriales bacterium]|nr:thioredoxin domain-containing protein [Mycobacteriales bacterium]